MAEGKKSFVLYVDLIHSIRKLVLKDREDNTNNAGELFLHSLEYVNDENPKPINFIVDMAFEPIKQQLKRDLKSYEDKRNERSKSGRLGNLKRYNEDLYNRVISDEITLNYAEKLAKGRIASKDIANIAVNDTVTVNGTDTDNNNKSVDVDFISFKDQISKQQQWSESWYMQHGLKKGSLSKLLDKFILNVQLKDISEQPKTLKDFKSHFVNWTNKQDQVGKLIEYSKHKSKQAGAL